MGKESFSDFVHHQDVLDRANETLKPFGKQIIVENDGDDYFSIGSQDLDGSNYEMFACGDFEDEVASDINDCLAHLLARLKGGEKFKIGQVTMAKVRDMWKALDQTDQVDLMVEFYYALTDSEKDRFLRNTENS